MPSAASTSSTAEFGSTGVVQRCVHARYAATSVDAVVAVAGREEAVVPGRRELTRALARKLDRLMSCEDEYKAPRLLLQREWNEGVLSRFGPSARLRYNLHPAPALLPRHGSEIELGPWARPVRADLSVAGIVGAAQRAAGRDVAVLDERARAVDLVGPYARTSCCNPDVEAAHGRTTDHFTRAVLPWDGADPALRAGRRAAGSRWAEM